MKMQLTSEQWIFVVTYQLRTISFKEVQQFFEQHFRDRVSPTKINIWKDVRKYKTERSSLSRSGPAVQNVGRKTLIFLKKGLSKIEEYQLKRINGWTLVRRVHLDESLNAI